MLDHFEMAQAAAQNAQAPHSGIAALQAGIAMIQQQLKSILAETGLEEMDASGKPFDPTLHEAVSQLETADVPEGQVVQQIRKGYKLRDRLLRPATVVVAKKPAAPTAIPPAAEPWPSAIIMKCWALTATPATRKSRRLTASWP